jgi:hypothetical protein
MAALVALARRLQAGAGCERVDCCPTRPGTGSSRALTSARYPERVHQSPICCCHEVPMERWPRPLLGRGRFHLLLTLGTLS